MATDATDMKKRGETWKREGNTIGERREEWRNEKHGENGRIKRREEGEDKKNGRQEGGEKRGTEKRGSVKKKRKQKRKKRGRLKRGRMKENEDGENKSHMLSRVWLVSVPTMPRMWWTTMQVPEGWLQVIRDPDHLRKSGPEQDSRRHALPRKLTSTFNVCSRFQTVPWTQIRSSQTPEPVLRSWKPQCTQ